jgi:hypothetical protein
MPLVVQQVPLQEPLRALRQEPLRVQVRVQLPARVQPPAAKNELPYQHLAVEYSE